MNSLTRNLRKALTLAAVGMLCAGGSVAVSAPAAAATCSDVELVFARGTGEPQGASVLQRGTLSALKAGLPGKTVTDYSVVYPASADQNATPGQVDMVKRITTVARDCPNTKFVLGGYSQGATVVDMTIGVSLYGRAPAGALPASLEPKVAAIVTFGNPLGNQKLAAATPTYASRIAEFCASGDPVCRNGSSFTAHVAYMTNGDTTKAGQFAAGKVKAAAPSPGTPPAPEPAPTTDPVPVPAPTAEPAPEPAPTNPEAPKRFWCTWLPWACTR